MSSLSQKLAAFQDLVKKEQDKDSLHEVDQLSLDDLKGMKITFRKAKLGQPYEEAFHDQKWTKWFVQTYESSHKLERVKFLRYVNLKVSEGSTSMPTSSRTTTKDNPYLRRSAQVPQSSQMAMPVGSEPWDMEEHRIEEILAHQEQQDFRMSRIESALTQIIHHLEPKPEVQQAPIQPWTMVKEEPN